MKRLLFLVPVLVLGLGLTACGDDGGSTSRGGTDAAGDAPEGELLEGDAVEILANDNSFDPETARVAAGTEVTFVNNGRNDHNVIPEDEDAEWRIEAEDFEPGEEATFTFDEPGTYRYYCSIHGTVDAGMPGVLVVE